MNNCLVDSWLSIGDIRFGDERVTYNSEGCKNAGCVSVVDASGITGGSTGAGAAAAVLAARRVDLAGEIGAFFGCDGPAVALSGSPRAGIFAGAF